MKRWSILLLGLLPLWAQALEIGERLAPWTLLDQFDQAYSLGDQTAIVLVARNMDGAKQVKAALQANPDLAAKLEKIELPLEDKAYYLMLSNGYVASNPEQAAALWDEIERQRESPTYQQQVQAFLARPQP